MYVVTILICLAGMAPQDCHRGIDGVDVIAGPEAKSEITCMRDGQAYLAETSLGDLPPGAYVKITCQRTTIASGNVG